MKAVQTAHGELPLPVFLPDATRAVVRAVDATDLRQCGVRGLVVNTLHLSTHPGATVLAKLGGVHAFMDWDRPVVSDSGGFQVYSLIASDSRSGSISRKGFQYRPGEGHDRKLLTPEKCIQKQFQIGSDILFCLDHCTHPDAPENEQRLSVENTVAWARQCKAQFLQRLQQRKENGPPPLLFAVVQGGTNSSLRRECAERLLEIGFDGFGYGGWPINEGGALVEMVDLVSELIPHTFPLHALGIGKPDNIVSAFRSGYRIFDCALPTRDARQKRLFTTGPSGSTRYHYLEDKRHARSEGPLDAGCDCALCSRNSAAYLHHLFAINDHLAYRLATIHNLRYYTRLLDRLAASEEVTR